MPITAQQIFGSVHDPDTGKDVEVRRYTMNSQAGVQVQVMSYGAGISDIQTRDRSGNKDHITLGFDDLAGFQKHPYHGSTIGRRANRIQDGLIQLEDQDYQLSINSNNHHLHGGIRGWDKYVWESRMLGNDTVVFCRLSPDGEEGYPGHVLAEVKYKLEENGSLIIDYEAHTTHPTPICMTNHAFFNLGGYRAGQRGLLDTVVQLNADRYSSVKDDLIPTGKNMNVGGTWFDLRFPVTFGEMLPTVPERGYDINYCLHNHHRGQLMIAARFNHPPSGRMMEVYTTEPGMQLYTGNNLPKEKGVMVGLKGHSYTYQGGFCCEPQNYPNAVNQPLFPDDITYPGTPYKHTIMYKFGLED